MHIDIWYGGLHLTFYLGLCKCLGWTRGGERYLWLLLSSHLAISHQYLSLPNLRIRVPYDPEQSRGG